MMGTYMCPKASERYVEPVSGKYNWHDALTKFCNLNQLGLFGSTR